MKPKPETKPRVTAQRKFAQGASIPPTLSPNFNAVQQPRAEQNNKEDQSNNVIQNNLSVQATLDLLAFNKLHIHTDKTPLVVIERLVTPVNKATNGHVAPPATSGSTPNNKEKQTPKNSTMCLRSRSRVATKTVNKKNSKHLSKRKGRGVRKNTKTPQRTKRIESDRASTTCSEDDRPLKYFTALGLGDSPNGAQEDEEDEVPIRRTRNTSSGTLSVQEQNSTGGLSICDKEVQIIVEPCDVGHLTYDPEPDTPTSSNKKEGKSSWVFGPGNWQILNTCSLFNDQINSGEPQPSTSGTGNRMRTRSSTLLPSQMLKIAEAPEDSSRGEVDWAIQPDYVDWRMASSREPSLTGTPTSEFKEPLIPARYLSKVATPTPAVATVTSEAPQPGSSGFVVQINTVDTAPAAIQIEESPLNIKCDSSTSEIIEITEMGGPTYQYYGDMGIVRWLNSHNSENGTPIPPDSDQLQATPNTEQLQPRPNTEQSQPVPATKQTQPRPATKQMHPVPNTEQVQAAPATGTKQVQRAPNSNSRSMPPSPAPSTRAPSPCPSETMRTVRDVVTAPKSTLERCCKNCCNCDHVSVVQQISNLMQKPRPLSATEDVYEFDTERDDTPAPPSNYVNRRRRSRTNTETNEATNDGSPRYLDFGVNTHVLEIRNVRADVMDEITIRARFVPRSRASALTEEVNIRENAALLGHLLNFLNVQQAMPTNEPESEPVEAVSNNNSTVNVAIPSTSTADLTSRRSSELPQSTTNSGKSNSEVPQKVNGPTSRSRSKAIASAETASNKAAKRKAELNQNSTRRVSQNSSDLEQPSTSRGHRGVSQNADLEQPSTSRGQRGVSQNADLEQPSTSRGNRGVSQNADLEQPSTSRGQRGVSQNADLEQPSTSKGQRGVSQNADLEQPSTSKGHKEAQTSTNESNNRPSTSRGYRASQRTKSMENAEPSTSRGTGTKSRGNPRNSEATPPKNPRLSSTVSGSNIVEAPTFHLTEEEFNDPIAFYEKIVPAAAKFGICKVVPPASFKPKCVFKDDIKFNVTNHYIPRLYSRWGPAAREMGAIKAYLATQNVFFSRVPLLESLEVNLPKLYYLVQRNGGLRQVIEKKRWGRVAEEMRFNKGPNTEKILDSYYVKYLMPYDVASNQERQKIMGAVEKCWIKKHRKLLEWAFNPLHNQKKLLGESDSSEDEASDDAVTEKALQEAEDCVVAGRSMNLSGFRKVAKHAEQMYLSHVEKTTEEIEKEYWRLVLFGTEHVCVNAASIDASSGNYGFSKNKNDPCYKHPWNLKVLTNSPDNVLRALGSIIGATATTVHLGMAFSTSCWHRDPHGLPWMEYMHEGPTKIWYGIPDEQSDNFRKAVESLCPTSVQNKTIWLSSDITMIPPELLREHKVSLARVEQRPGEFVVIFPKSYACSICTGMTCTESAYFAPFCWLGGVHQVYQELQDSCEPTMFPLEQLLIALAKDPRTSLSVLQQVHGSLTTIISHEMHNRAVLEARGIKQRKRTQSKRGTRYWKVRESVECHICRRSLYLSKVSGMTTRHSSVCIFHGVRLLETNRNQDLSKVELIVFYSEKQLEEILASLKRRLV